MKHQRLRLWVITILLAALLLAGCNAQNEAESAATGMPLLAPRVNVGLNEEGGLSVFGLSLERVGGLIGQDLSAARLDPALIQQLKAAGVQNVEAVATGSGVYLYINGKPLPYLDMDEATRQNVGALLKLVQVNEGVANMVQSLLNNQILSRVGIPVLIELPGTDGAAPVRDPKTLPLVDTAAVRAAAAEKVLIAHLDVAVDDQGVPTLAGSSTTDLQTALGKAGMLMDLSTARINPATVATLKANNIALLQIDTEPEGLYTSINGQRLPRVAWDAERLGNALELYRALQPNSPYLPLAQFLLPYIQPADIELGLSLPLNAGQTAPTPAPWIAE